MARTLDPVAHAVRRDAFLDAAEMLIRTKGYDEMSIQDILVVVGASRGAFYHYFDSKGALLEALVGRMVAEAMETVEPLVMAPDRSATDKLVGVFAGIANWKGERSDLMLGFVRVWLSDENALVRDKFRGGVVAILTPIFTRIIRQGTSEKAFAVPAPEHAARVLVALVLGMNEQVNSMYVDRLAGRVSFAEVEATMRAYREAFERILGARPGSLPIVDPHVLRQWFG